MTDETTTTEQIKELTFYGEEITQLQESLESYLWLVASTYAHSVFNLAQGKNILAWTGPVELHGKEREKLKNEVRDIEKNLLILETGIPKIRQLVEKTNAALGIEKSYDSLEQILNRDNFAQDLTDPRKTQSDDWDLPTLDEDATTTDEPGLWEEHDDNTSNEQEPEISEDTEVLHEDR